MTNDIKDNPLNKFAKKFPLRTDVKETTKVIIGQQPYLQSLNQTAFAVRGDEIKMKSKVALYRDTESISFLVTDWVKVQDSLEMLFNLMFGHKQSLFALAELRASNICPIEFADLLWEHAHLVMVNAINYPLPKKLPRNPSPEEKVRWEQATSDANTRNNKHQELICTFIDDRLQTSRERVRILLVGGDAVKVFEGPLEELQKENLEGRISDTHAIHPTGTNLNQLTRRESYYNDWISSNRTDLDAFRIFTRN